MDKPATTRHPIHPLLAQRWSPRAFGAGTIDAQALATLVEAVRWAPSCFNAQPWRYCLALRQDNEGFAKIASCLMEGNSWAKEAAVLAIGIVQEDFAHNGKPNAHAEHDLGLANAQMTVQAEAMGLRVHQMGGFHRDKAVEVLGIPAGFHPVVALAIGSPGDAQSLGEDLATRELAPRERLAADAIAFGAGWETKLDG